MIGKIVSHYKIIEKIGQGGMGEVFLAEDTKLDRKVALKFLPSQFSADEQERKRFIHEAKAAAALNHANIVTVYEIGDHEGQIFIAMEYVDGRTLKEIISGDLTPSTLHPMPIPLVLDIAIQLASGLAAAHVKGIVHRDLKPANIMLTEQGAAKIVDFGLAKLRGMSRLTKSGTTLGTVAYMSPEQALGKDVDQRSDIWSLGVILYEMLTNKLPFPAEYEQAMLYAVINEEPESVSKLRSDIPEDLQRIVRKALAKKPDQRYAQAEEMLADLRALVKAVPPRSGKFLHILRRPCVAVPAILVLVAMAFFSLRFFKRQAKVRWAKDELLPKISRLAESRLTLDNPLWQPVDYQGMLDYVKIFELAIEAEKFVPQDPQLTKIFANFSTRLDIQTDPPGAKVYVKYYQEPDKEWRYLGESPLNIPRMPVAFLRLKMEKEGYEPVLAGAVSWKELSWGGYGSKAVKTLPAVLDKTGTIPAGMVRVAGGEVQGIGKLEDFYMDRFEVTNRQFREFIQKGGYQKKEYWKNAFAKEGKTLTWDQAMAVFVDKTGFAGPPDWQAGDYPEGEDDFPVSGISWYEAAAFAEYAGKILPGGYHWGLASGELTPMCWNLSFYEFIIPQSNFKGKGPERVGSNPGITAYGLYDMAGNVREWCANEMPNGRLIRGGAADDASYMFANCSQLSPFDRSQKNGFRCCLYLHPERIPKAALALIKIKGFTDFYKEKPVSDQIFQVYKEQYAYDKVGLDFRLESRDDTAKEWVVEKISFAAAYENERVPAFLYLPKNSSPPFQTIIYFPCADANSYSSSKFIENSLSFFAFIPLVKNGRAVMFPVYKSTYERGSDALTAILSSENTHQYTELFIKVVKDLRRSIDYLETRPDIDSKKLAYSGFSWGGQYGAIIPAIEERLKVNILNAGGMWGDARPEVSQINYVTRVKTPTLMLNGRYDLGLAFNPMFDLLGTPAADKRLVLYDTDHIIPLNECIKESSKWLDKYFGPVKPRLR
jgi:serine/threonine protein kinase